MLSPIISIFQEKIWNADVEITKTMQKDQCENGDLSDSSPGGELSVPSSPICSAILLNEEAMLFNFDGQILKVI